MKKDNWWNRLFHKKEVKESKDQYVKAKYMTEMYLTLVNKVKTSTTLLSLLEVHKAAWKAGFQNKNLGPDPYGMFRTEDIMNMKPWEVFLGGIRGLNTFSISEWEKYKGQKYGVNRYDLDPNTNIYSLIMNQYENILLSNMKYLYLKAEEIVDKYERL